MEDLKIRSNKIEMVSIETPIPYEKNMHIHSPEQIERLSELIKYQGFRNPLVLQSGTNRIASGHGRLEAAKKLGMEKIPVIYQEFESEEQFYAYVVSDNAIGKESWAQLDLSQINTDIIDFGPDLDIEMLGLKDFTVEPMDNPSVSELKSETPEQRELINEAWREWSEDILLSINILSEYKIFCQSYNKGFLKIKFLEALYNGKRVPRSSTLGYMHHRMSCSGDGKNGNLYNLLEKIVSEDVSVERLRFGMADKPNIHTFTNTSVAAAGHKAPLDFPAELAQQIYNEFSNNGNVLDPCHGWGGRLLGFLLSDAKHYTGVDASPETGEALLEMANDLNRYHNKEVNLIISPFEDTSLRKGFYDFALTSPPYFDREQYVGGDQAHTRYKTYDEFINGFYTQLIFKTYEALKTGAHFALQVGNQKYDLDKKAISISEKIGFTLFETRSTDMKKVGSTKDDESSEMILIFKK